MVQDFYVYGSESVSGNTVTSTTNVPGRLNGCNSNVKSVKVTINGPTSSTSRSSLIGQCKVAASVWVSNIWATKTTHTVTLWSGQSYSFTD